MARINVTNKSPGETTKLIRMVRNLFGNGHLKSIGGKTFVVFRQGRRK